MNRNCSSIRCCVCNFAFSIFHFPFSIFSLDVSYHYSPMSLRLTPAIRILIHKKCHQMRKLKIKWKLIILLAALQYAVWNTHLFISSCHRLFSATYCATNCLYLIHYTLYTIHIYTIYFGSCGKYEFRSERIPGVPGVRMNVLKFEFRR